MAGERKKGRRNKNVEKQGLRKTGQEKNKAREGQGWRKNRLEQKRLERNKA